MIEEIKNINNSRLLFNTLKLYSDVNLLIGGNGVGKTTLINSIKRGSPGIEIKGDVSKLKVWSNSEDNHRYLSPSPYGDSQNYSKDIVNVFLSGERSEGENVIHSFMTWLEENIEEGAVIVVDEIDSGLSVDNINAIMCIIANVLKDYKIQFILSVNSWHPVYTFDRAICLLTGDKVGFAKDYASFCQYSFKAAKKLEGIRTRQKKAEQREIAKCRKQRERASSVFVHDSPKNTGTFKDHLVPKTFEKRLDETIENFKNNRIKRKG